MPIEIDDHQRPVPHPTVFQAQYRTFHFHHADWAERFNRERNQIAQLADLSPFRRWLGFLPSGPPPPDEKHGCTSAHSDSSDICKPRSVCEMDMKKDKMIAQEVSRLRATVRLEKYVQVFSIIELFYWVIQE